MNKKTFSLTLLCACLAILFYMFMLRWDDVMSATGTLIAIFRPAIIGGVLAFVLNLILTAIHPLFCKGIFARYKKLGNSLAIVSVYLLFFGLIAGLLVFVLPQLADSLQLFAVNVEGYYQNFMELTNWLLPLLDIAWLETFLLEQAQNIYSQIPALLETLAMGILGAATGFAGGIVDTFLGFMVSIYILVEKQGMADKSRRIIVRFLPEKISKEVLHILSLTHRSFSSFVGGQCIESLIIGVLCFIGMSIFGFAYAPLISVIIATTSLIPIVGPILGTIPCVLILLLVNPMDAVWFVVFIIVLQQLESNLIYPRVVGTSVGLPALWVLLGVTIGGGLGGIVGMVVSIPVLSVVRQLIDEALELRETKTSPPIAKE